MPSKERGSCPYRSGPFRELPGPHRIGRSLLRHLGGCSTEYSRPGRQKDLRGVGLRFSIPHFADQTTVVLTRRAYNDGDTAQESVKTLRRAGDIIEQMFKPARGEHIAHAEG